MSILLNYHLSKHYIVPTAENFMKIKLDVALIESVVLALGHFGTTPIYSVALIVVCKPADVSILNTSCFCPGPFS